MNSTMFHDPQKNTMDFFQNLFRSTSIEELNSIIEKCSFSNFKELKKILKTILNPTIANQFWTEDSCKALCSYVVSHLKIMVLQHIKDFDQLLELPRPALAALFCQPSSVFLQYIHEPFQLSELARTFAPSIESECMVASINLSWFIRLVKNPRDLYMTMSAFLPVNDHINFLNALDNDWLNDIYLQVHHSVPDFKQFANKHIGAIASDSKNNYLLNTLDNQWLARTYVESRKLNNFKHNIKTYFKKPITFTDTDNQWIEKINLELYHFTNFKNTERSLKIDNSSQIKPLYFHPSHLALLKEKFKFNDFESYVLKPIIERVSENQRLKGLENSALAFKS